MISIKRPYIENENGKSRLCAEIAIAPEIYEKWKKQIGSRREYAGYEKAYSYGKDKFQLWYEVEDRQSRSSARNDRCICSCRVVFCDGNR